MFIEILKLLIYSILIVLVCKYILVKLLRRIAKKLALTSKTVGSITGVATSIPEFLTVSFSAGSGLIEISLFNILSSNIINVIQYFLTIFINKNQSNLNNKAIKIDLLLVFFTILIPIIVIVMNLETSFILVPLFLILLYVFYRINKNAHKLYLKNYKAEQNERSNKKYIVNKKIFFEVFGIILVGGLLYILGNSLSDTLEILCMVLKVPEFVTGMLLGVITSIPEFITFFEAQKYHKKGKKEEGIIEATGNLLSSNLINLFIIQTIGIIIYLILG